MTTTPGSEPDRFEFQAEPWLLSGDLVDRRDFLRRLGGGLLVLAIAGRARGGQDDLHPTTPSKRDPATISAWIHIGADGPITAYTGKVEIGQNARTSLSQAVAEELKIGVTAVRMVMADTDLVPRDVGTFGSLSTPVMFLQLRRAAAAAREALMDLAAERWAVDRSSLTMSDGQVVHEPTGRSAAPGELTRGEEIVRLIPADIALIDPKDWSVAGTSVPKVDGRAFVTGSHVYPSDLKLDGMLHGRALHPPSQGARATSVDTTGAEAISGLTVVRDGEFLGVYAPTEALAKSGLEALKVDWEAPPPTCTDEGLGEYLKAHSRLAENSRKETGSVASAMERSEIRLERTYGAAYIAHAPLEPRACVARWDGGRLTVHTGTQVPFGVRSGLARAFGLAEDDVRVIIADTGSGYGGKHTPEAEIEAARLARAAGRPVRVAWSRADEFSSGYLRPAGVVEARAGLSRDGVLLAWEFRNYNSGTAGLSPPYEIAASLVEFHPAESPLRQGSYRALASTFNHFARESLIDELAREAGLDALEIRLRNLEDDRLIGALTAVCARHGWQERKRQEGRGHGLSCAHDKGACVATCAEVEVKPGRDGVRVLRLTTCVEAGAIVNPRHLENQVEGATMMGLGGALFERIRFQDGAIRNGSFARYRVPRFNDLPTLEVVLLDRKDIPPAGAGEIPIVTVAPAIASAIFDATGERPRSLPMSPDGRMPT